MVNPANINPAQAGANSPESIAKEAANTLRPIAQTPDEGKRRPFKDVMNKKEEKSRTPLVKKSTSDDEEEPETLLELAAQTLIRKSKPSPSITDTAIFNQEEAQEEAQVPQRPTTQGSVNIAQNTTKGRFDVDESDLDPNNPIMQFLNSQKSQNRDSSVDINLAATPQNVVTTNVAPVVQKEATDDVNQTREALMKLAQQMIDKIQQVQEPGRTDTTLRLQHPPLFKGVSFTITEFSTSQKQLNVTFSGLENNSQAQMLLQMPKSQETLRQALLAKGYTLQMITIELKVPGLKSTEPKELALQDAIQDLEQQPDEEMGDATSDDNSTLA